MFYEWSDALTHMIVGQLCTFNQELSDEEKNISELQQTIIELSEDKHKLTDSSKYIRSLLDIQIEE